MENPQVQRPHLDSIQFDRDRSSRSLPLQFRSFHHVSSPTCHGSTPPISVPPPNPGWSDPHRYIGGTGDALEEARFLMAEKPSPIQKAIRARKQSIAFDPKVKTDVGSQLKLHDEPPAGQVGDYFQKIPTGVPAEEDNKPPVGGLGAAFRQDQGSSQLGSQLSTRYERPRRRTPSAAQQFLRGAFPTTTTEEVAPLTSDSNLSPRSDFSPQSALSADSYFPEGISYSPLQDPRALQGLSPWNRPNASHGIGRKKSFNFERSRSRSRSSGGRRTMSERSLNTCSGGVSPASLFLNSFNSNRSGSPSQCSDPDEEGQEVGPFALGKQIGYGGFSIVREACNMDDGAGSKCAVKIVRKRVVDVDDMENDKIQAEFEHEIALWRMLNHENILPLIAVYDTPFATFAFMKLNSGGSLFDMIRKSRKGISARLARRYSKQLASALRYLHEDLQIVHGDIKPENCLLDMSEDAEEGGNLMLCDFGLSKFIKSPSGSGDDDDGVEDMDSRGSESHSTITGSLQYASPELFKSSVTTTASDVWAFAVTVYALHTGALPFSHSFPPKLQLLIINANWDAERLRQCWGLSEVGEKEAYRVVDVVNRCLCRDPQQRCSIRDVLQSPWLANKA